jgi:filamentous hemagglutinin
MYAGKIMLIGTEAGLGVNNAGLIQSTRAPLTLDHNGWLSNSGTFYSHKDTRITTQGQITHSGTIAAQGAVQVQSRAQPNDGAPAILGTSSSLIASGLQTDGTLLKSGAIGLHTNGNIQLNGQLNSLDDIQVHGAKIDATASQWTGQKIVLNTQLPVIGGGATTSTGTGINATSATLTASHSLEMSTSQSLHTDQSKISAPLLQISANDLSNRQGSIKQTGQTPLALKLPGLIDNTGGTIASTSTRLDISKTWAATSAQQAMARSTPPACTTVARCTR